VVGNDAAWGQMMRPQGAIYGWDRLAGTLLHPTRYDKVVEALGGHGEFVERPEQIRPALERAAASGKPALVNVIIRQDRDYKGGIYV
jgi:acetolactate synthase-1/2/3 large subunit